MSIRIRGAAATGAAVAGVFGFFGVLSGAFPTEKPPQLLRDGRQETSPASGERVVIPGPLFADPKVVDLRETAGDRVTIRLTPIDDAGAPLDGGRIVVLLAGERRTIDLADVLPIGHLLARRILVETLAGTGQARVEARWLARGGRSVAVSVSRSPSRVLNRVRRPTSKELIDEAEVSGALDHETAVLYRVWADFGDARLPESYRGDDSHVFDSLYLATVAAELDSYSAATQEAVLPFLVPPAYEGSWASAPAPAGDSVSALQPPFDPCSALSPAWDYRENYFGKVRVWFEKAVAADAAAATQFASILDSVIWPELTKVMNRDPQPDGATKCNGGSDRLDVYIANIGRSYANTLTNRSSFTPAHIVLARGERAEVLAHEFFHVLQFAFKLQSALTSSPYNWWTEGSAMWAADKVYPTSNWEHYTSEWYLNVPRVPLDANDPFHVYGSYLLPFYQHRKSGGHSFVRQAWEGCEHKSAVEAVDDVLPGGLEAVWPLFSVRNYNREPAMYDYVTWDELRHFADRNVSTLTLEGAPDKEVPFDFSLLPLTAHYQTIQFKDPAISTVVFYNGATFKLTLKVDPEFGEYLSPEPVDPAAIKGVRVHALVKIAGQAWKSEEDWTGRGLVTFCRDLKAERIEELVLVISNSDSKGRHLALPPGLSPRVFVSNMGCYRWSGTTNSHTVNDAPTLVTWSTDVVFQRVAPQSSQPSVDYVSSGTLNVTVGGTCTGQTTANLASPPGLLRTVNFVRPGAAAYRGFYATASHNKIFAIDCHDPEPELISPGAWFVTPFPPFRPLSELKRISPDGRSIAGTWTDPAQGITFTFNLTAEKEQP